MSEQPEPTHCYILTLEVPNRGSGTFSGSIHLPEGANRADVYAWIRRQVAAQHPELGGGTVIFFSLDPLAL